MKIRTILVASILFLVSVQVKATTLDTVLAETSEVAVWSELSPVSIPAVLWLFGTALIGFVCMSRRTNVN